MSFNDYINDLLRNGKCSFTIQQAQHALEKSPKAIYSSIEHMFTKNELANPAKKKVNKLIKHSLNGAFSISTLIKYFF